MRILEPATDDEVYHQWLKSEAHKYGAADQATLHELLPSPDFNDNSENSRRRALLFATREPLLSSLPDLTKWQRSVLDEQDLQNLYVIKSDDWDEICAGYLLRNVRYPEGCSEKTQQKVAHILERVACPGFDRALILIGTVASGPFTVLDGNHRALAMTLAVRRGTLFDGGIPAFLGLSPRMTSCVWYSCP